MTKILRRFLIALLRVPPQPQPPAGSPESVRVFRASPRYFRYRLVLWLLKQLGAVVSLVIFFNLDVDNWIIVPLPEKVVDAVRPIVGAITGQEIPDDPKELVIGRMIHWLELIGSLLFVLQIPFTYTMVRLEYEMRWYIVTDRSLRIREGLNRIREITMTFANVQNLMIERGPIQRILGIADLKVRSAGGGGTEQANESSQSGGEGVAEMHVACFRGVDDPDSIRNVILEHLRSSKAGGLGDPEDAHEASASAVMSTDDSETRAARSLLDEARALRQVLESG